MIAAGVKAKITCVDPARLDKSFAGRDFDLALLEVFPTQIDPCGENGEFHTFVHEAPVFGRPIDVQAGEVVERDGFVFADVLEAGRSRYACIPEDPQMPISRRKMLTASSAPFVPQVVTGQAPAQLTGTNAGRRFKAFVRHGTGASVEELRLHAIQPREVLVRTQASAVCYTIVGGALRANAAQASIPNHSGMGIVEEVGPLVKRVQKGDRVVVPGTPQCGVCYQCLHGRADWCQFLDTAPAHPLAEMSDGTQVVEQAGLGGLSELMVVPEEYCCPVFTDLSGRATDSARRHGRHRTCRRPRPRADRAGLERGGAGRGARGNGCDPVRAARQRRPGDCDRADPARREIALKVGGTIAIDPNAEGNGLIAKIQSLCKGVTDRRFAGGRISSGARLAVPDGADFTINAVGSDWFPPKVEVGPDPTAILPLQQCFDFTRAGGHIVMLGVAWRGNVSFNAASFSNRGRTFYSGQQGGLNMLRDIPRYVKLIEKGVIDMKSMVTSTIPLSVRAKQYRRSETARYWGQ